MISLNEVAEQKSLKPILKLDKLSKAFPGVQALDEVSIEIAEGEIHALLGENGSGKSTLTKCLVGAYKKDSGSVFFDGREVDFSSPAESYQNGLSVIYQERSLIPKFTVLQNVFLGNESTSRVGVLNERKCKERFSSLSKEYGFDIPPREKINRLGVAEQKTVEIMKALNKKSRLIIMDEPTASLSESEVEHFFEVVRRLKQKGISIIYITHILDEVFALSDRITILRDGKKVDTVRTDSVNKGTVIKMMIGKSLKEHFDTSQRSTDKNSIIMSAKNIVNKPRVKGVSFDLRKGEILGITGLTGAGKTELARSLFGVDRINSGEIWMNASKIRIKSPVDAIKHGIALIPEDRKEDGLILLFELYKNITLAHLRGFSNRLGILSRRNEMHSVKEYKKKLDIRFSSANQITRNLSGGNQQKIVIAKWLETKPSVLIMDEATQGIDVNAKEEIYAIVRELSEEGFSVIFISSEVPETRNIADRILVLREGKLAAEFDRSAPQDDVMNAVLGGTAENENKQE